MAKTAKRAVSLLLMLLMVATCVWSAFTVQAASDELFKDDFSSSALSGWGSVSIGSVADGQYTINGTGANSVATLGSASSVAVMADVKMEGIMDASGKAYVPGMSSILFHASADLKSGYEFGLGISQKGTTYAIVYRTVNGTAEVIYRRTTDIPGTANGKVLPGTKYALKVITQGENFSCYINEELFFESVDSIVAEGLVGVSTWNAKGTYDNFKVSKVGQRVLEGIRLENTPEEITLSGDFDLDIIAEYSGVFVDKRLNANSAGVAITGMDSKLGKKTLTVTYGGKSAKFTTNVVASTEGSVLYEDAFNSSADWTFGTAAMGTKTVKAEIKDGKLSFKMPTVSGFDLPLSVKTTSKKTALLTDAYYSVSVDAAIHSDSTSLSPRAGIAEVVFATIAGSEYRFRITSSGSASLYAASTLKATATYKAAMNKVYRMRVDVRGDTLVFFINDEQVFTQNVNEKDVKPLLRLTVHNGSVSFDNFKVTKLEKKSRWSAKSIAVLDGEGKTINSYSAYSFNPNALQIRVTYFDGSTAVKSVTEDMVSGFNASSRNKQNILITYGSASKKLSLVFTDYIYFNDFSDGLKGLVETKTGQHKPGAVRSGMAFVDFTVPEDITRNLTQSFTVPGCKEFANYAVSADVMIAGGNTHKGLYAGLKLRVGAGTDYTYRLQYVSGVFNLSLLHNVGDGKGNVEIASWPNVRLVETYPEEIENPSVGLNGLYNLKIELVNNAIFCYFNNVLLDVIQDDHESYEFAPGDVQLYTANASVAFDNVCVTPLNNRKISKTAISGDTVDGVLQVYQGYELDPDINSLSITYNDGLKQESPLWKDYIVKNYDPNVLGKQKITISYAAVSFDVDVMVVDRPDYVATFVNKVKAFKKGSLTAADQTAVSEMVRYFGTLTPYEVQHLEGSVYKDYVDLVKEMDVVKNEALKGLDCIYYNDFTQTEDMEQWTGGGDGEAFTRNGYLTVEMARFGLKGAALYYNPSTYAEIKSVEADVMLPYPGTFAAIVVQADDGSYYHLRLTNKYTDENGKPTTMVQLYRYTSSQVLLGSVYTELKGITVEDGKWNNLRLTLDNGFLCGYVDDVLVLQHDDSQSLSNIIDGYVGFRVNENDARYDNLKMYGIKKELQKDEYVRQITPTEYNDDFEDETVGESPSHWVEENVTDDWKVISKGGSKTYGTTVKSRPVYSWLHAFECDPIYKARFLSTAKNSGKVGFLTRMYDKTGYLAVGYNYANKKWFLAGTMGVDMELQLVYAEAATDLAAGEWHDIEINAKDTTITVLVDGKEVLTHNELTCIGNGRMGVFADGADMYVDNVYVKCVNGTNFDDGVVEFTMNEDVYENSMEVEDLGNGVVFASHATRGYISYDDGLTFTQLNSSDAYYSALSGNGSNYVTYLEIGKDRFLKLNKDFTVSESTDGMKSWKIIGRVLENEERFDPVSKKELALWHTSSMTKIEMPNGVTRLFMPVAMRFVNASGSSILGHYTRFFYSDDWGRTWTESENNTLDVIPNYNNVVTTIAEGKVIKCADGSLRFYQSRNSTGAVIYVESKDYGVTWTEFGKIPYMQCDVNSFGIEEDPAAPGTYYMAFVNASGDTFKSTRSNAVQNRTRLTLVRTTDGKNWEYLTDVERTTGWATVGSDMVRQILDPSICVTEDYVYVTSGQCNEVMKGHVHNEQRAKFVRFEKDKLSARPWDDATMQDSCYEQSIEIETLPQTKFGYGDLFNNTGLQIKSISVNGRTTIEDPREFFMMDGEPNMFKLGKQTVRLMSRYYSFTEYEIEIVPNYDLIWEIRGKGTVDPNPDATLRMMEGSSQTFTLKPDKGYKVNYVKINGENVKIKKKAFTISNVQETQEIVVSFTKLTIMDYLPWIILGAVVVAGLAVGCILLIPKFKNKSKKAEQEEDIDISSNSTPPADDNQ